MSTVNMKWSNVNMNSVLGNSPYEIYPGEMIQRITPDNPKRIELHGLQAEILLTVNRFLVMTSRLVTKYLNLKGITVEQRDVQREMKKLAKNDYLNKYHFVLPDKGRCSEYKFYTVGHKGRGFLYSRYNINAEKVGYLEQCSAKQMKKILASNQLLIETELVNKMNFSVVKMIVDEGVHIIKNTRLFRALGFCQDKERIMIIEPVRMDDTYIKDILEKLNRIDRTIGSKKCNIDSSKKITVAIVAESYTRMEALMNCINERDYKNFDIVYTYDTLLVCDEDKKLYRKCSDMKTVEQLIAV